MKTIDNYTFRDKSVTEWVKVRHTQRTIEFLALKASTKEVK